MSVLIQSAAHFRRMFWRYPRKAQGVKFKFQKFTDLGGYPLFLIMADGGCLCADCATKEKGLIHGSMFDARRGHNDKQWIPYGIEINYEDAALFCDHCNKRIESAYAESDGGES